MHYRNYRKKLAKGSTRRKPRRFTAEETQAVEVGYQLHGNKWAKILSQSAVLRKGGRSSDDIQRKWLNLEKKKNREVKVGADPGAEGAVNVIRLSDTNGLPVDYVQSRRGKGRGGNGLTAANLAAIGEGDEDDDGSDSGGEYDDEGGDFGGSEFGEDWRSNIRRKGETPEEKKARKAAVKLGRKDARAAKKGLKNTFKQEQAEMSKKRPTGDVRQGLSVRIID